MTNGDRVRALPDEVLAEVLWGCCFGCGCKSCPLGRFCKGDIMCFSTGDWLDWLESEVEECST